jgi:hypothetical protein
VEDGTRIERQVTGRLSTEREYPRRYARNRHQGRYSSFVTGNGRRRPPVARRTASARSSGDRSTFAFTRCADRDAPFRGTGLGLDEDMVVVVPGAAYVDDAASEVDVLPAERGDLASSQPRVDRASDPGIASSRTGMVSK